MQRENEHEDHVRGEPGDERLAAERPGDEAAQALDEAFRLDPLLTESLPEPSALLRAARHFADLSQRELAARAGVAKSVVGDVESGRVASPTFALMVTLLEAAGLLVRVIDAFAMPVQRRPLDAARDAGGRHWPAHLDVRPVHSDWDWWHGRMLPGQRPLPAYTADWRRLHHKTRVRRLKGQTLAEARARAQARNTPQPPEVTRGKTRDG